MLRLRSQQAYIRVRSDPRLCSSFRYCPGVIFSNRLNTRRNWRISLKPHSREICPNGKCVVCSSSFARFTRACAKYSAGVRRMARIKECSRYRRDTPASATIALTPKHPVKLRCTYSTAFATAGWSTIVTSVDSRCTTPVGEISWSTFGGVVPFIMVSSNFAVRKPTCHQSH